MHRVMKKGTDDDHIETVNICFMVEEEFNEENNS